MNFVSGAFIYLLAKSVYLFSAPEASMWAWQDMLGLLVPMMHLFLLRVFDEHKDFDSDALNYPDRVIQKGIFTLTEVRNLGIGAFVVQFIAMMTLKPSAKVWAIYLLLWSWTLLMTKEFFMKEWLKKHFLVYGVSHLMVTPLIFLCCLSLAAGDMQWTSSWFWALALSVMTGWLYELTRKTKAPEEETEDMSYSRLWGVMLSSKLILFSAGLSQVLTLAFFASLQMNILIFGLVSIALLVLTYLTVRNFQHQPSAKNRKKNEGVVALISLYAFLIPIVYAVV